MKKGFTGASWNVSSPKDRTTQNLRGRSGFPPSLHCASVGCLPVDVVHSIHSTVIEVRFFDPLKRWSSWQRFYTDLKRLVIERFNMRIDDSGPFTLPHLEELSLFQTCVTVDVTSTPSPNPSFLSRDRFPSLRALALREYRSRLADQDGTLPLPVDFLAQLETLVINQFDEPPNNRSLIQSPIPIPFLYDLSYSLLWRNPGRRQPIPSGSLSREYIRIQHPRERIEIQRGEIEAALFLAEDLVNESQVLKVLYLDLFPMDGKYQLDEELKKVIEHLEDSRRSRKVEIVWEDKEKDFCNSLVSREFWKRSKEIRGRNQR